MKDDAVRWENHDLRPSKSMLLPLSTSFLSCCGEGKRLPVAQTTERSISLPVHTVLKAVKEETHAYIADSPAEPVLGPFALQALCNYRLLKALLTDWGFGRSGWKQDVPEALACGHPSIPPWLSETQPGENELCKPPHKATTQLCYF